LDRLAPEWEAASASLGIHMTDEARAEIHAWVLEHPIERVPFVRATIVGQMAHTLRDQEGSLGAAVSGMQESLDRLEFRMSLTKRIRDQAGELAVATRSLRGGCDARSRGYGRNHEQHARADRSDAGDDPS
jgi:hypothetical protein